MLCPELPGGILGTGTENPDGIPSESRVELVHGPPDTFTTLPV